MNSSARSLPGRSSVSLVRLLLVAAVLAGGFVAVPASAAPGVSCEQADARIVYAGAWSTASGAGPSGGSHAVADSAGAKSTVTFWGTSATLVASVGPKYGIASVQVDGGAPADVDLYATETAFSQIVHTTGDLPSGIHTLTLSWTGRSNAAATGTVVGLDRVDVAGTLTRPVVQQNDHRIVTYGSWTTVTGAGPSGGSHALTSGPGSYASLAFSGTAIDLFAPVGPKYGVVSVSIDGQAPTMVDLYRAATGFQELVFSTQGLPAGNHVVRVAWTGQKNIASTGTIVGLDAVAVDGPLQQAVARYDHTDSRIAYGGTWEPWGSGVYFGGSYGHSSGKGHAISVAFEGARFDWVTTKAPYMGVAMVSVDGGPAQRVDLYAPAPAYQQTVYSTGTFAWGRHTVLITYTGMKNPASTATSYGADAFDIGGTLVQAPPPPPPAQIAAFGYPYNRYIVIDKSDLRLYYVVDGVLVANYPVAVGKASTPTPSATWRIGAKYYSSGVYGPRKMRLFKLVGGRFVYSAYNIHGTNVDSSVGTYASHGCIRMHNYDVIPFFDMVPLGTMVITRN